MITVKLFEKTLIHKVAEFFQPVKPIQEITPLLLTSKKEEVSYTDKTAIYEKSIAYIKHKRLDSPQFVAKYGKSVAQLEFQDLLFTMGYKRTMGEIVFSYDALHNPVAFCLSTVNTRMYVEAQQKDHAVARYNIDPYSVYVIGKEMVEQTFKDDPLYTKFMILLGKHAKV